MVVVFQFLMNYGSVIVELSRLTGMRFINTPIKSGKPIEQFVRRTLDFHNTFTPANMHAIFIFRNVSLTSLSECMSRMRRKKRHTRAGEEETETEDIYDNKQREEMLKEDEITAAENAFMQGREMTPEKRKRRTQTDHKDTASVELAEDEYEED